MKEEAIKAIEFLQKYKTETDQIEAKTALIDCPSKLYDTISAFSNKNGGIILFGINEKKGFSVNGVYDANDLQTKITNLCSQSMEPVVRPEILTFEYEENTVVAVKINEIEQIKKPCFYKPYGLKKGAFIRIGDRDDLMTDYEIYAIQSYKDRIIEDKRPTKDAKIEDLNKELLEDYIDKVKVSRPNFSKFSFEKCLKLSNILDQNGKQYFPTLAGIMVFGEYPQSFYPQLFVACTVLPGKNLGETGSFNERFIDNQRIEGTIEEMFYKTMNFITRNMKTRVVIDSLGKRTDFPEYPVDALKEAIVNALVHRDYSLQTENAYISVMMFTDRIEITNPGILYGTNKIEKLGSLSSMEARNPNIVKILEEKHTILENRHTGIPTIISEMRKAGLPAPEFIEERDCFKVILRNGFDTLTSDTVFYENEKSIKQLLVTAQDEEKKAKPLKITAQDEEKTAKPLKITAQDEEKTAKPLKMTAQDGKLMVAENRLEKLLQYCVEPRSMSEILKFLNLSSRSHARKNIIKPLIDDGRLKYFNPKINSKNQKYVTVLDKQK